MFSDAWNNAWNNLETKHYNYVASLVDDTEGMHGSKWNKNHDTFQKLVIIYKENITEKHSLGHGLWNRSIGTVI